MFPRLNVVFVVGGRFFSMLPNCQNAQPPLAINSPATPFNKHIHHRLSRRRPLSWKIPAPDLGGHQYPPCRWYWSACHFLRNTPNYHDFSPQNIRPCLLIESQTRCPTFGRCATALTPLNVTQLAIKAMSPSKSPDHHKREGVSGLEEQPMDPSS